MPVQPPSIITSAVFGDLPLLTSHSTDDPPIYCYSTFVQTEDHGEVTLELHSNLDPSLLQSKFTPIEPVVQKLLQGSDTLKNAETAIKELFDEYEIEITDFAELLPYLELSVVTVVMIENSSCYYSLGYSCPEDLYPGALFLLVDKNMVLQEAKLEEFEEGEEG